MNDEKSQTRILLSAIAADVFEKPSELVANVANRSYAAEIAKSLNKPKLVRELRRKRQVESDNSLEISFQKNRVIYQDRDIGKIQTLDLLQKSVLRFDRCHQFIVVYSGYQVKS